MIADTPISPHAPAAEREARTREVIAGISAKIRRLQAAKAERERALAAIRTVNAPRGPRGSDDETRLE